MTMTSFVFKDADKGYRRLHRYLKRVNKTLTVGIHEDEGAKSHSNSRLSVAEIGTVHEFGVPGKTPQRSFIRGWYDERSATVLYWMRKLAEGVKTGKYTAEKGLSIIGLRMVAGIQQRIASNIPPPLKQSTIDRKGSSVALIDTGQLRSSIGFRVH